MLLATIAWALCAGPELASEPNDSPEMQRWWPELDWKRADERPVVSSGLSSGLLERLAGLGALSPS